MYDNIFSLSNLLNLYNELIGRSEGSIEGKKSLF